MVILVERLTQSTEALAAAGFALMQRHGLGRRRIAGTRNAAAFLAVGVDALVACNPADLQLFEPLRGVDACAWSRQGSSSPAST